MEPDSPMALFITQIPVVLGLAVGLMGLHKIQESGPFQPDGQDYGKSILVVAALGLIVFGFMILWAAGLSELGLVVGLPVLAFIPAYWLYWSRARSRVFIWIAVALWLGLAVLVLAVDAASSGEGPTGYWGLVAAALASGMVVYGYRKVYFRKLTLSPGELERAAGDPWGTIGAAVGVAVGGALLALIVPRLAPDFQAAVNAFIIGLLAFSLLGCAAWQFLWEIKRRRE
ncbi:MAG: hypothetical protein JXM73_23970 [Anaerolineae bacterium]|nr:hypothetical protein [Anaerolineae bacterium]